ncbi:AAA family ATPase [Hymenobacter sp. PAMC 26628]|uniref:AAA family ATPase n=1 Tax=Hymenobacter sp. PAMC 26628 TaxID=1484118 RepID=UPI000902038E|nr:ATP-binding protein [Hymenobacter sp. PAMC 26628]
MLKRLHLRNFTVFADADFEFGPGLNVIVGANGTGKSHVLKAAYAMIYGALDWIRENKIDKITGQLVAQSDSNTVAHPDTGNKFKKIFQTVDFKLGELIRRSINVSEIMTGVGIEIKYPHGLVITSVGFTSDGSTAIINLLDKIYENINFLYPILIPAKEVLTLGWLLALYDRREIPIDEVYPDLLKLLMGPPLRRPEPVHIVERLQKLIGGKVDEEGGRFYLFTTELPKMEMNMVAEGMRKFATLYKLLANGTLTPETTLFWDEPEANLNPALLKEMAAVLAELARAGFQIILATHSLFLMKELHILSQKQPLPVRYFGLYTGENGGTQVETTDNFMQLQHVAALDAELAQTFDFEDALDQDYAGDS